MTLKVSQHIILNHAFSICPEMFVQLLEYWLNILLYFAIILNN